PYDLVFSNAALQWVGNHERLLPQLIEAVAADGILAVQMPRNHDFATHRLMRQVAAEAPWRDKLAGARDPLAGQTARILLRLPGAEEPPHCAVGNQLHPGDGRG